MLLGAGCSGDDDDETGAEVGEPTTLGADEATTTPPGDLEPDIGGVIDAFTLPDLVVAPGTTITIDNLDDVGHSFTADDSSFDTGVLQRGETGTFTSPSAAGTYGVHCQVHASMTTSLIVQ